jgi:glycosyltransferase involved in cell wall biosynthesis
MFQPGLRGSMGIAGHQDLGAALRALGHEFQLVSTAADPRGETGGWIVLPEPSWARGLVAEVGAPLLRTRWLLASAIALARHLRVAGRSIDVLYTLVAYPQATAAALAIAWSGWQGRFVVMPAGEDVMVAKEASFGFRRFPVPRYLVGWTLRRAHGISCISPAIREIVARYRPTGVIAEGRENVPAAVVRLAEAPLHERLERREQARRTVDREHGTAGAPIVLALGRLHPVKGFDRLIGLLPDLPHRLIVAGPSLEIRGRGDIAAALRSLSVERGVADRVVFTGRVPAEKSYELLAAADVLAIPSHCESIPKTAVEAAALGTPFVVTDTCGIAAVPHGKTLGRVVKGWNATAFARALAEASEIRPDPAECEALVRRFSPERVAGEIDELLDAIA